jgi:hypothetical protein
MRLLLNLKFVDEIARSIENKDRYCVGILLSMSNIENNMVKNIKFLNNIVSLKISLYMLVAISRPPIYRPHIKAYRLPPLKRLWQEN